MVYEITLTIRQPTITMPKIAAASLALTLFFLCILSRQSSCRIVSIEDIIFKRRSSILSLEFLHELNELFNALNRHCIVDRRSHTADSSVTLAAVASATNFLSRSASPVTNGTFIRDLSSGTTVPLKSLLWSR